MTVYFIRERSTIGERELVKATETDFQKLRMREPRDLEPLLMTNIEAIAPGAMVVQNQSSPWADSNRQIDILAIDKNANLVVIEIKRDESDKQRHVHMELQALRYAAMISNMRFEELIELHAKQLKKPDKGDTTTTEIQDARTRILDFLERDELEEDDFGNTVRIILVAAEFDNELLTTVSWLADNNMDRMDIMCVKLHPCTVGESIILDIHTIFPLPDISDYQINFKKKRSTELAQRANREMDYTKFDLKFEDPDGPIEAVDLGKGRLMYEIVKGIFDLGSRRQLKEIPKRLDAAVSACKHTPRPFLQELDGVLNAKDARAAIEKGYSEGGITREPRRWFIGDSEVFHYDGKTYVLTNQWKKDNTEPTANAIQAEFSDEIKFTYDAVK